MPRDFIEFGGDDPLLTQPGLGGCKPDRHILVRILDEIGAGDADGDRPAAVQGKYQALRALRNKVYCKNVPEETTPE